MNNTDDMDIGWAALSYTRALDAEQPERICAWCFHPRNSAECQFAARHIPYREMFA